MKFKLGQQVLAGVNKVLGVIVSSELIQDNHKGHYVCLFDNFDDSWGSKRIERPIWYTLEELVKSE